RPDCQASSPEPRGKPGSRPSKTTAGERQTVCWRGMDSNFRYRGRRPASGRSLRAQRVETDAAKREFGSGSCLFAPPWVGSGGLGGGLCFPFPTPGNGQQESRLAPIGRHLRLLRRGVLRTGFPRQAAFPKAVMRSMTGGGAAISLGLTVSPFILAS